MATKILGLQMEHFKRVNFVEITPDGNLVIISGKNGAGKSSILDFVEAALRGGKSIPSKPVTRGHQKGGGTLDLGDFTVKRTFTAAGGMQLVVKPKDGDKYQSPQAVLDGLCGNLSFDPLEFVNPPGAISDEAKSKKRGDTLRQILGLDFAAHDQDRQKVFNERTAVNRDLASLQAQLSAAPHYAGAPETETSAADIIAQQEAAAATNAQNAAARTAANNAAESASRIAASKAYQQGKIAETEQEIKRLQDELASQKRTLDNLSKSHTEKLEEHKRLELSVANLVDVDLAPFKQKAFEVEITNEKVRANKTHADLKTKVVAKTKEADALTRKLEDFDAKKRTAIQEAKYPVPGLSIGEETGEVLLNGLPFDQASTREQLVVSVSIAIALNPKLMVCLIRAGNDVDADGMKLLAEIADKADCQIWVERIARDVEPTVIIEDGYVVGSAPPESVENPQPAAAAKDPNPGAQDELGITP